MESFDSIFQHAAQRKGGIPELEALLPSASTAEALRAISDDRYLAEMTRCVFRSGFVWTIIAPKWPGFEEAFHNFDVSTCALLSEEEQEQLTQNAAIVRHAKKIASVARNAACILDVRAEHGSFGNYLADWPGDESVGWG